MRKRKKRKQNTSPFSFFQEWLERHPFWEKVFEIVSLAAKEIWYFLLLIWDYTVAYSKLFDSFFPNGRAVIQVSVLYFCCFVELIGDTIRSLMCIQMTEFLNDLYPTMLYLLATPLFSLLVTPERTLLISFFILDRVVARNTFNLNKLVRYNITLMYSLLMVRGCIFTVWDLLFNKQPLEAAAEFLWDDGALTDLNVGIAYFLLCIILVGFVGVYSFCYWCAICGKYSVFPAPFTVITDSAAFWLRIKTPTMWRYGDSFGREPGWGPGPDRRFGKRKKKK